MKYLIFTIVICCILCSSCGSTKYTSTIKQLEEQVTQLEEENKVLKGDMKQLQLQLSQIRDEFFPKPSRGTQGGAPLPKEDVVAQQLPDNLTAIQLPEVQHDFGVIAKNSKVSHEFKIKNVGENPLKIENVKASCGCTVPEWPKEPIPIGGEGIIKVTFNSAGKAGAQNKAITITANTEPINTRVYIRANVPR
ncbi:MAG: DUF1573 domain-containing protein [Aureispira sp.]